MNIYLEALGLAFMSTGLLWILAALILARRSDRWMDRLIERERKGR